MSLFPIASDKAQLTTAAVDAGDSYVQGVRLNSLGTLCRAALAGGAQYSNGLLLSNDGQVIYVDATAGLPADANYTNGLPLTAAGALCISTDAAVTYSNGLPLTANGALSVDGVSSFDPASLFASGEPGAWLDPSDMSTMFQDAAGTTPVTAVEQPVGRILDKSGRGNHATQTTATSRPVLKQDGNGKYYLLFDGVDDSLVTPTITPGTDKAQVFAGVRKLSDVAGMIAETSSTAGGISGAFYLLAGEDVSSRYSFLSRGSVGGSGVVGKVVVGLAPDSAVLTATGDISNDLSTLRRNGVAGTSGTADQGTGNYLAYPLYIGRRGGTSLPFNGHLYSLAVRFGPTLTADQIAQTETWVNGKTGAY